MTIHTKSIKKTEHIISAITCDCCKKKYTDEMELQEFLHWKDTGGYGNMAFGDRITIEVDLCQYCIKELLGKYVRTYDPSK